MPQQARQASTLCNLLNEMITAWYVADHPDAKARRRNDPPHGAYIRLEEAAVLRAKTVSTLLRRDFGQNTSRIHAERAQKAWSHVPRMVEVCVAEPDRQQYLERLAGAYLTEEGGGVERPPGYVGRLRTPDGQVWPPLTDVGQTDRLDLQVPLLREALAAEEAAVHQLSGRLAATEQQRHDAEQVLHAARATITELQYQVELRDTALTSATAAEQQLVHQVQDLLMRQAAQRLRINEMAAHHDQLAEERDQAAVQRDVAYRFATEEAEQRRALEKKVVSLRRELKKLIPLEQQLIAARAHADQLAAELTARTARSNEAATGAVHDTAELLVAAISRAGETPVGQPRIAYQSGGPATTRPTAGGGLSDDARGRGPSESGSSGSARKGLKRSAAVAAAGVACAVLVWFGLGIYADHHGDLQFSSGDAPHRPDGHDEWEMSSHQRNMRVIYHLPSDAAVKAPATLEGRIGISHDNCAGAVTWGLIVQGATIQTGTLQVTLDESALIDHIHDIAVPEPYGDHNVTLYAYRVDKEACTIKLRLDSLYLQTQ
ncbi:hypothetical protein [Krasilnikovia sp. MM14-A1004]|uniref:hypothetical protein n=1 Tax=Krasilnikovia sp. MM14-A1004 TaxID=3373541 RepID=UPI00399C9BAD